MPEKDIFSTIRIGVTGYSVQKFDVAEAQRMLREAYDTIDRKHRDKSKTVVSGLTDLGVLALAYREAKTRGWRTVGIACSKAEEFDCFAVDEREIVGNEWGKESETFLNSIDVLVRVGGGNQAKRETETFKKLRKQVIEYDLPAQK